MSLTALPAFLANLRRRRCPGCPARTYFRSRRPHVVGDALTLLAGILKLWQSAAVAATAWVDAQNREAAVVAPLGNQAV